MSRELLWRGFPTDQRGTYFRQFWDVRGNVASSTPAQQEQLTDIKPLATWLDDSHLGEHAGRGKTEGHMVLLIRGDLLRRYPRALIYAVEGVWSADKTRRELGAKEQYPMFRATQAPDITMLGFLLTEQQVRGADDAANNGHPGWFFVLQEQPTEPRFGLDVATTYGGRPDDWRDLTWGHLAPSEEALEADCVRVHRGPAEERHARQRRMGQELGADGVHHQATAVSSSDSCKDVVVRFAIGHGPWLSFKTKRRDFKRKFEAAGAQITSLTTQLQTQQQAVVAAQGRVSAAQARVADAQSKIPALEAAAASADQRAEAADQAVEDHLANEPDPTIEVDGRPPRPNPAWRTWKTQMDRLTQQRSAAQAEAGAAHGRLNDGRNQVSLAVAGRQVAERQVTDANNAVAATQQAIAAARQRQDTAQAQVAILDRWNDEIARDPLARQTLEQIAAELSGRAAALEEAFAVARVQREIAEETSGDADRPPRSADAGAEPGERATPRRFRGIARRAPGADRRRAETSRTFVEEGRCRETHRRRLGNS